MSETQNDSNSCLYKGPKGEILVADTNNQENDHPNAVKQRYFSVNNARLYMACQEKDQESPVRRRTHLRKSISGSRMSNQKRSKSDNSKDDLIKMRSMSEDNNAQSTGQNKSFEQAEVSNRYLGDNFKTSPESENRTHNSFSRKKKSGFYNSLMSQQFLHNEINYLSSLEASAVIAVFDNAIDELAIIKTLLPDYSGIHLQKYRTVEERYGKEDIIFSKNLENKPQNEDLVKLQRERNFVTEILRKTILDLQHHNNYWTLYSAIRDIHQMEEDDRQLVLQRPALRERLMAAQAEVRSLAVLSGPQALKEMLQEMQFQDEWGDVQLLLWAEARYVDRWETARRAQQLTRNGLQERDLRKAVQGATHQLNVEARAGQQIKMLMQQDEHKLKKALDEWDMRRFADMDQMTITIFQAKNTLEVAHGQTEAMRAEVAKRTRELRRWRIKKAEEKRLYDAALAIQKCWRAFYYRRLFVLGQFILKRSRLQLLADAAWAADNPKAPVKTRLKFMKDRDKHVLDNILRAYLVFQALNGNVEAQKNMIKEGKTLMKGKKGKGGKGKGKK